MSQREVLPSNLREFVSQVEADLRSGIKHDKRSIEKIALAFNINDLTEIKELTELAIVNVAREFSHTNENIQEKFQRIVKLYNDQVILSHRTSQSILLQQYSTPAPIAYLMGVFCGLHKMQSKSDMAFEPSAGNGLLTIAGKPELIDVNEIDKVRNRNLRTQGFANVLQRDAAEDTVHGQQAFYRSILTNPPFGRLDKPVMFDTFPIADLDHLMALRALESLNGIGKAAIIIGGHTKWDHLGRIQKGKNRIFFNYLYSRFNVLDVIQIDGHKLYARQGTAFPVRLILIYGRKKKTSEAAPLKNEQTDKVVRTFDELFKRVMYWTDEREGRLPEIPYEAGRKYYNLKPLYPNHVFMLQQGDYIMAFGDDAESLEKAAGIETTTYEEHKRKRIAAAIFPLNQLDYCMDKLKQAGHRFVLAEQVESIQDLEKEAQKLQRMFERMNLSGIKEDEAQDLGAAYTPASQARVVLNTQVPDSMSFETQSALDRIKAEVGGNIDNFVRHRLGYFSLNALYNALSAEQIDAVAMAIYNIEARGQGMIIGDQTGIGKGRIAAAMIRYGKQQGLKPIFITEKASLFSSLYRDLVAIGSGHLKPFIINGKDAKSDIKDEDGNVIYEALPAAAQASIFESKQIPAWADFIVSTYSQFNSRERRPEKPNFLYQVAEDNLLVMDESHNSSGSSNTGEFMQSVVGYTRGVVFLSATFAKRPDNMPIYAMRTAISEANMTKEELVEAIRKGGVALQEILSSQLVAEGQMIRRERSFEGVEVNYISLDTYEAEHRKTADGLTKILRDIISFQATYVDKRVAELDEIAAAEGKEIEIREGTSQAGVDNIPYFSKVFNVINQMLFSIKAGAVADRAILRLKEGKKPVIAFASTMGSFIEQIENEHGLTVSDGDLINCDFTEVLRRGLEGVLRYTEKDVDGEPIYKKFDVAELGSEAVGEYARILKEINTASSGICISPIDLIKQKLEKAGYRVAEVTGRKYTVQLNDKADRGYVNARKRLNANDAFRQFNNNEADVLMINQSGSTGESAHAIVTPKVPEKNVKQRVMIVLQAELDINTEVQKRGRINRTGQILKPIYDYVISAIPAEKRLMMMLQKKLKSLDANTTSNQKQSTKILDVPDFLNKYGDKVVKEYLLENKDINELLGDPLKLKESTSEEAKEEEETDDAAHRVSGRVAVLSTKMQADFYTEVTERYNDLVEYMKQTGEYDLEVETLDLKTQTLDTQIIKMGRGGESAFGEDSILEKVEANILKKPYTRDELEKQLKDALGSQSPEEYKKSFIEGLSVAMEERLKDEITATHEKYEALTKDIAADKKLQKILDKKGQDAYFKAVQDKKSELVIVGEAAIENLRKSYLNKEREIERMLKFFTVGRKLAYEVMTFTGKEQVLAVCLGVMIDKKKKNPYTPSAIKVRVAIANSYRYYAIPASYQDINDLIASSHEIRTPGMEQLLDEWEQEIKQKTQNRGVRFIVTGNLLQAFGLGKGKLVSYTTKQGLTRKGIMLSGELQSGALESNQISVPIIKALPILYSLTNSSTLTTSNEMSFFRQRDGYKVICSAARSKAGDIYLDKDLLQLVEKNLFEKISGMMQATVPEDNLKDFVSILQDKFGVSALIHQAQLPLIKTNSEHTSNRKKIVLPPAENELDLESVRILELEAEALLLELELAA